VVGILRRNPYYHGERAHHLDAIVLTPQPDIAQDISAIESGSADYIAEPGPALSSGQFPGAGTPSAGEQRYFRSPLLGVDELAFNTVRGPLANARLRRAISYALDRPALAAALADRATDRLLPIGMPGYRATHVYPPAGPDLERARALARDFRGSVSLEVCGQPSCLEIGRIVAADLARIGVSTFVRQYPGDLAPATTRPGADIVLARVFAPYPDPVAALRAELGSRYKARLDALAQLDRPQRLIAAGRLELDLLRRSAPIAAIGTPTIPELFSTRVGCKTFQPLFFGVDLAGLCLRR
jgi:ABC-type transport system substrate-binding protein